MMAIIGKPLWLRHKTSEFISQKTIIIIIIIIIIK